MKQLKDGGGRIGALVNTCGREKGQSQLPDVEDRLVHKWAMLYWRPDSLNGLLAHKDDAAAMMVIEWDQLVTLGIPFLNRQPPSSEAVRERINSLECYSTYASRFGRPAADKKFTASGEPVPVERPFERIFMDGTEYEHSVFYSDSIKIPAAKMKGVMAMDAFSQFIFPFPVFAGPYRPEMGIRALIGVLTPPRMSDDQFKDDPVLAMIYGLPSDVMIDRDRTLITPRLVPGAIKIFSTVELAEAYHADAKSKLENFHKFVKQSLSTIQGRILGPSSKYDRNYNPLLHTQLTRAQYIDQVEQCRLFWNDKKKKSLGDRSPNEIMKSHLLNGGPRLGDPKEVLRTFASTPSKQCQITPNGLVYDNIQYRWNREGLSETLSSNYHKTPFADRIKGAAKVFVTLRTWEDNIDEIEIYDEVNQKYHPLYSSDPGYTNQLSRWEHHVYQKYMKTRSGATSTDRLRKKGQYLSNRQKSLGDLPFRERAELVGLLEGEELRLSGHRGQDPGCAQVPELYVRTDIDGAKREDLAKPPPQTKEELSEDVEGSADVRSDPSQQIAQELGADEIEPKLAGKSRWDFSDDADDADDEFYEVD